MAKFQKGQTGNPNGRPAGALSQKTIEAVERVEFVLSLLEDTIEEDIEKLKPSERARLWNDLQEYIRPKLARTENIDKTDRKIIIELVEVTGENPNQLPQAAQSTEGDQGDSQEIQRP